MDTASVSDLTSLAPTSQIEVPTAYQGGDDFNSAQKQPAVEDEPTPLERYQHVDWKRL